MSKATADLHTSIIIPTLNSPLLDEVIKAVLSQEGFGRDDELIVIGRDEANLRQGLAPVSFLDTGRPVDASTARNTGIAAASGSLLLFLDSDCIPLPGWLAAHRAAHAAGHAVVGGGVLPDGDSYWHLVYNLAMFHEVFSTAEGGPRPFLPTLNLSIDRSVIDLVGGLDTDLPYSHDVDWTTRMRMAGFQPFLWPSALVRHQHNRITFRDVWRDAAMNGQYARQVRLQHKDVLGTPAVLQSRTLTLLLSPAIAAYVTGRIIWRRPDTLLRHPAAWPGIYSSKIAWCWGASRS